jgi:hypothetical protein
MTRRRFDWSDSGSVSVPGTKGPDLEAPRAERRTTNDERARKRAEADARRREHKLKHGGTGFDGTG